MKRIFKGLFVVVLVSWIYTMIKDLVETPSAWRELPDSEDLETK